MINQGEVIKGINKALVPFFMKGEGGIIALQKTKQNFTFRLRNSEYSSQAYNDYGNEVELVDVIKWFNNFWLFIEVRFNNSEGVFITLSVFQGDELEAAKTQLFRAEWDDYNNENPKHAQPHWHFLPFQTDNTSLGSSFLDFTSDTSNIRSEVSKQRKVINLNKFHFAMNGDWANTQKHIHQIKTEKVLENWFGGILAHIKTELEYVSKKAEKAF